MISMETAPAVGVPVTDGSATWGCVTVISRVRAQPTKVRTATGRMSMRIVVLLFEATTPNTVNRIGDPTCSSAGPTRRLVYTT